MWLNVPMEVIKPIFNYLISEGFTDYLNCKTGISTHIGLLRIFRKQIIPIPQYEFRIEILEGNVEKTGSTNPQIYVRFKNKVILRGVYSDKGKLSLLFLTDNHVEVQNLTLIPDSHIK